MTYTITPARYAKGKMIIRPKSDGSGFKTRAARLAEAKGIGGRWVHRSGGYTVSPAAARRFEKLYAEGWDASTWDGKMIEPKPAALHKGRTWSVMRLPWTGFRDMIDGSPTREAAAAWAFERGYALTEAT